MFSRIHSLPHHIRHSMAVGMLFLSGIFLFIGWQKTTSSQIESLGQAPAENASPIPDFKNPSESTNAAAPSPLGGIGESMRSAFAFASKNIRYSDEEKKTLWQEAKETGNGLASLFQKALEYGYNRFQREVTP